MTVQWQTADIPFSHGLAQRQDELALEPPSLLVLQNGEFDELGGIRKRKPYEAMSTAILGGGELSDVRRLAVYGDELLCFTRDKVYSWVEREEAWTERAEYLAPHVEEAPRFISVAEQVTPDRVEVGGVVWHAWRDEVEERVKLASADAESGAVIMQPAAAGAGSTRPRLVAVGDQALFFCLQPNLDSFNIQVGTLDPESPGEMPSLSSVSGSPLVAGEYDVVSSFGAAWLVARTTSDEYFVARIDSDENVEESRTVERACEGPVAVSVGESGGGFPRVAVCRVDSGAVRADVLVGNTLSNDLEVDADLGPSPVDPGDINHVTAAWDGDRFRVLWTTGQSDGSGVDNGLFRSRRNTLQLDGTTGDDERIVLLCGLASRAFVHDGDVYAWFVFAGASKAAGMEPSEDVRGQLQNTYFLLRFDGELIAKAASDRAAGFRFQDGSLAQVQDLGDGRYAYAGGERRVIEMGDNQGGYAQRGLRDVVLTFDSDEARRSAHFGRTLYISGGQVLQYDGRNLVELGFHTYPWNFIHAVGSDGDIEEGTYTYKATWRWDNAQGELDRSTTASSEIAEVGSNDSRVTFDILPLSVTRKTGDAGEVAAEVWRTEKNPGEGAAFHLATSKDPADDSDQNHYVENDLFSLVTLDDGISDEGLRVREQDPELGGVLSNLAPPPASVVVAAQDRLYLAGLASDPYAVWYSKFRGEGEVAAFNDLLRVTLPSKHGAVVGLEVVQGTAVVFQERAVHMVAGEGLDNLGQGQNLGPPQRISEDVGATSADAIASTPEGLVFHSPKGWYLVDRGFSLRYIGGPVSDFDDDDWIAVDVLESQHQIRCLSREGRMLAYDWLADQWAEWTIGDGLDSVVWRGRHVYLSTGGPKQQRDDDEGMDYSLVVETAWIRFAGLQGYKRVRRLSVLGDAEAHNLRIQAHADYDDEDEILDDTDAPEGVAMSTMQVQRRLSRQKVQAVKIRITDILTTQPLRLTGLSIEYGQKPGLVRLPRGGKE